MDRKKPKVNRLQELWLREIGWVSLSEDRDFLYIDYYEINKLIE